MRFPEFSEYWKNIKLNHISNIFGRIGFRGYTINDIVKKEEQGALALSPTNIEDNRLIYNNENTYISIFKYEESPEIKIAEKDIVFVKTGSTVGKVAYVDSLPYKTTLNPQLVVFKDIKVNPYFLSVLMSTKKFQGEIRRITVGGAVPTLSQAAMGNISIKIPSKEEQNKIAQFISLLDVRIATQSKIIE
ncbi:MAG: restriction endonuclease subunit S, partial [Muribaculaceae bacterium]|nr:restriction endonuclease subunit S [Muribaculaceae bacterium]